MERQHAKGVCSADVATPHRLRERQTVLFSRPNSLGMLLFLSSRLPKPGTHNTGVDFAPRPPMYTHRADSSPYLASITATSLVLVGPPGQSSPSLPTHGGGPAGREVSSRVESVWEGPLSHEYRRSHL
ncbi:hypothetical protein Bbelb_024370 [Branchiostoma belcheri]|nr:hypothetical protein Bbelb_024370 [Branchiostoma belcheri]